MVVAAPTTPLPALSKADKLRLTLYFSLGQSVEALALKLLDIHRDHQSRLKNQSPEPGTFHEALTTENTALAPILSSSSSAFSTQCSAPPDSYDLAAWTLCDQIAPHIAYRRAEHLEQRKQRALAELDTILAISANPIEKRRAATTMLRMLVRSNSPSPREGPGGWVPGPQQPHPTPASPAPGGRGARAAGGEGSVSTPSTNSPSLNTPPTSPLAHDVVSSTSSSHLCSSAPSMASSPDPRPSASSAAALSPLPLTTPNPSLSPEQVINHITRALEHPENPDHLATFESFLSPDATINNEPALNPGEETTPPPGQTHTQHFTVQTPDSPATFKVTLTRPTSGPHRDCWLLQSLEPDTT